METTTKLAGELTPHELADLPLTRGDDIHVDTVRGVRFAHNPWGHDAIDVLEPDAAWLLEHADGRSARVLASGRGDGALGHVPMLLRHGFLRAPGVTPNGSAGKPERFFNIWLHLTNACNLACPYCYVAKDQEPMSPEVTARVLGTIETTAASGTVDRVHVRFSGGEPMLRFAELQRFFDEATRRCERHGVRFTAAVLTNGTVVPRDAVAWLKQHDFWVSMSLDGVGAVHDIMRPTVGGQGSFDKARDGLKAFQDGGIRPYILITVGRTNLSAMPELTDFLLEQRVGFRYSLVRDLQWGLADLDDRQGVDNAAGRAGAYRCGVLTGPVLDRVVDVFTRCYGRIEDVVAGKLERGEPLDTPWRGLHKFCDLELWKPMRKACGAGETYIAIGEDGSCSPCHASLHEDGNDAVDPGQTLFQLARGQTQFPRVLRQEGNSECNACRHRASCAGGCPLLLIRRDGHVDGRSPYCLVFRDVIPRVLRIAALERALQRRLG